MPKEPTYTPVYKGRIEGWTVNYTKGIFWRVESIMEWHDVMQESYIVFMRCEARYPDMDTPQHFMSLYQRAWKNRFTDLSLEATSLRRFVGEQHEHEDGEQWSLREHVGETDNDGQLSTMLRQAPEEVRKVCSLMLNAPQEMLDILLADWRVNDGRSKSGGGHRINKALGLPKDLNVYKLVEDYFRS